MNRDEAFGWGLSVALCIGLFFGMRVGWTPRRGYRVVRSIVFIPVVIKGAHSLWSRLRQGA